MEGSGSESTASLGGGGGGGGATNSRWVRLHGEGESNIHGGVE